MLDIIRKARYAILFFSPTQLVSLPHNYKALLKRSLFVELHAEKIQFIILLMKKKTTKTTFLQRNLNREIFLDTIADR